MTPAVKTQPEAAAPPRGSLRRTAEALLCSLEAARRESIERRTAAGIPDALERVTGRTSFDNAIETVGRLIERIDADPAPRYGTPFIEIDSRPAARRPAPLTRP